MVGLVVLTVALAAGAAGAEEWETVATGDILIKVRLRPDFPGARDVWAEGELAASARYIQDALRNQESYRHWMPYVTESRVLSNLPDGRISYTRLALPIVSHRDYVVRVVEEQLLAEDGTGEFRQRWATESQLLPERHGVVRLKLNEGSWLVTPLPEGRARFVYRFATEPGGAIPAFVAGLGQKGAVLDTVRAVERQARKLAQEAEAQKH
jgi:hypothetical protein